MRPIPKAGVVLGVLVAVWTSIMGFTGWYKHPTLLNLFWVVILIQIGVLIWGLRLTAREGRSYWGQVGAGTLMSLVGGVIIFLGSMLFDVGGVSRVLQGTAADGRGSVQSTGDVSS